MRKRKIYTLYCAFSNLNRENTIANNYKIGLQSRYVTKNMRSGRKFRGGKMRRTQETHCIFPGGDRYKIHKRIRVKYQRKI